MPLLSLKKLTVRFGGLTAVSGVDCAVEDRQIVSIIGPNGAGKTTVFNAITGIYAPTEGSIEFLDRPLVRPLTWRGWLAAVAVGLFTALAAVLAVVNVDGLWRAAIKRNYPQPGAPFSYTQAARSGWDYVCGRVQIAPAPAPNTWLFLSPDGRRTLASITTDPAELNSGELHDSRAKLEDLMDLAARNPQLSPGKYGRIEVEVAGNGIQIVRSGPNGRHVFITAGSREAVTRAIAEFEPLAAMGRDRAARRTRALVAVPIGFLIGFAGLSVVRSRSRRSPEFISRSGIARTFQNIRLFQNMTVLENVLTAMDRNIRGNFWQMALATPAVRRAERRAVAEADDWLDLVGLRERSGQLAKNLSYGEQRRLEIARALATEPRVLLLDEPAAGMNPAESVELSKLIDAIRDRGLAVLLIEHHMRVVMGISDRIAVLDYGSKIAEGTPAEIRANPAVIKAYLGSEEVG